MQKQENKKRILMSVKSISALLGFMSLIASFFEIFNIGRLIELILTVSRHLAFGIEIISVVGITIGTELLIARLRIKKNTKEKEDLP
jgi:hypothetical protein